MGRARAPGAALTIRGGSAVVRTLLRRTRPLVRRLAVLAGVPALALGCATSPATVELGELPSAEELYAEASAILDAPSSFLGLFDTTDYQEAIDKFQDIIDNYPYSDVATLAELRIADAYFEQERWEEALTYYRDFAELHPNHEKVPYTLYRTALCHYRQTRPANRDQTPTREALAALDQVIRSYPYAPEASEAEALWRELRTRLGESVMAIGDFYLEKQEFQSAAERYRSVLNDFPGLGLDATALYKLGVCYRNMNRAEEATQLFQVILENYQGSEVAEAAQSLIPAAN